MKNLLFLLPLLLFIGGCQHKNYYEVMNANQQRFGGWQLENAEFLNESYDLVLLIKDMSVLAEKRSKKTDSYLLAKETTKKANSLSFNYKFESTRLRVRLTSDLSKKSDEYFHQFDDITEANFDTMYLQYMKVKLSELNLKMETYTAKGKSERLVELADEVQDSFRSVNESLTKIN